MKIKISKYFWDLNKRALEETASILNDPGHSRFPARMVTFLSRCDKPAEVFSVLNKPKFIESWPKVKQYWNKFEKQSDFRDWWQTIYEGLVGDSKKITYSKDSYSESFKKIGDEIRGNRIAKQMSQSELALKVGMKQPNISKIEEGKMNITLSTLMRICKALEISNLALLK
ncbi:MAG: hypothetical protein COV71_00055 [Candidatus Omnitrophica bacterium CG11_big_fil_rev_8_21_14_0_20_41_12]|nr:MAG: hypothetical protein COV71_00055 [Candidatus Omnitrophica bacterium CG11_big_fil_rev_8_21_14_0_20_41_12]